MVRIRIDAADIPHPDMATALTFAEGCIRGDASVVNMAGQAIEICRRLRGELPENPAVLHLSGVIAFIMSNPEAANALFGAAVLNDPNYRYADQALTDLIADDAAWPDKATYLTLLAEGQNAVLTRYAANAGQAFAAGDLAKADHWGQRISALNNPAIAKLFDIETCRQATQALADAGQLAAAFERVYSQYQNYWGTVSEADVAASAEIYRDVPDRRQLAEIVVGLIENRPSGPLTVAELGCFGGFNLQNIHDRLEADRRAEIDFIGIEPSAAACRAGPGISPAVRFIEGGHAEMTDGRLDLPERLDICIISRVLMILKPDDVAEILNFLGGRAACVVICDDIFNADGTAAAIRAPGDFIILHAFENLLSAAGFKIADMRMADIPDRECTGFIVAENQRY